MLILTRRISEVIKINDNITITVLGVQGYQVRIGIDAPCDVIVHRKEVWERLRQEKVPDEKVSDNDPRVENSHE